MTSTLRLSVLLPGLLLLASAAAAQEGGGTTDPPAPKSGGDLPGGPPPGSPDSIPIGREQQWPSPTAEDWARPVLLTFQRTWEDALAVSKETNKPILICVNMDGEIASEHYAGVRYRQPSIAALYEPYVCVIASVYRHAPRDHDDAGDRIPCPRFGSVTCGEHIAIEPLLYEKFFDGKRIAPRHVMVEVDGKETYDYFYANDTASVFKAVENGIATREGKPLTVVRGDRPAVERVGSRDVEDRLAVESSYRAGDAVQRARLLEAAARNLDAAPNDLLRLALFGLDPDLAKRARDALARSEDPGSVALIVEALRVPMPAEDRDALIGALERLGRSVPRAQWLAVVHRGLNAKSDTVNVKEWAVAGGTYGPPPSTTDPTALEDRAASLEGNPEAAVDAGGVLLELAEVYLANGLDTRKSPGPERKTAEIFARLLFKDAHRVALQAEARGTTGWRPDSVLALAAYYGGDLEEAYARAEKAVKALPPGESSWNSMAVLSVFAEGRWKDIKSAVREKRRWPSRWLADLHAAYTVLLKHPHGTDVQALWHFELLDWLGTKEQATQSLVDGIARFPDSEALHAKLCARLLETRGAEGLEAEYARMLAADTAPPSLTEFAGRASVAVAENLRGVARYDDAMDAYARALERFAAALEARPWRQAALDTAAAMALAARARVAFQLNEDERATEEILASFRRRPSAAGDKDALGFSPGETGRILLARLKEREKDDLAARLEAALGGLDPALLRQDGE